MDMVVQDFTMTAPGIGSSTDTDLLVGDGDNGNVRVVNNDRRWDGWINKCCCGWRVYPQQPLVVMPSGVYLRNWWYSGRL